MELPTLIHPERLWWLLLLPVLWWLAQPPRPRRVLFTAHLQQWLLAQQRLRRRRVRFRALRFFLLAAAVVLAVLAHSAPRQAGTPGAGRLRVLLDHSASMLAAGPDGSTPWAAATAALQARLASLPPDLDVRVLAAGVPLLDLGRGTGALPPPAGGQPVDLAALAAALAAEPGTAVWTLGDGQDPAQLPTVGGLELFGAGLPNFALADGRCDDRWPLPDLQVTVQVQSCSDAAARGELRIDGTETAVPPVPVELQPGERRQLVLDLRRPATGGELRLCLRMPGDALAADDELRFALAPLPPPRLSVVAEPGSLPALRLAAEALAAEVGGSVVDGDAGTSVAFALVEGGRVDATPGARAIWFGCQPPGRPLRLRADVVVTDWDRTAPLLAGLDLADLRVQSMLLDALPPGRELLWAQGDQGRVPLLVQAAGPGGSSLHFAFRLQDSNLWLLPAFPQLLRRALLQAYDHGAMAVAAGLPAGESDLRACRRAVVRTLPAFALPGHSLVLPCLLLALGCLLLRAYVR